MRNQKNETQRFQEVERRLNRSEDVSMSRWEILKSEENYHNHSNVVCEELNADLELTDQHVINIGNVLQKEGAGKGGSYAWPIWMVQHVLENILNGTPTETISPNISSQGALSMPGVKVIVQEILSIIFIRKFQKIIRIIGETLADYCIGKVDQ